MTVVFAAPRTSQPPASPEQGPDPRWTDAEAHARGEDSVHEEAREPVMGFCTKEQYVDFPARNTRMSPLKAAQPKGHAYKDYYATWYESPNDPVHIHEATHQILSNRPELPGGGSW